MKVYVKYLMVLIALVCNSNKLFSQTILAAGDIAIVGIWCYNDATNDDSFSFVTFVDLASSTTIYFTDKGWTESNAFYQAGGTGETTITYTAPSAISAGTVLYYYGSKSGSSTGFTAPLTNTLSTIGDQLIAYQGSESSPTFIYAINISNTTGWVTTPGTTQNTTNSWLPTGLVNGTTALSFIGADNASYTGGSNSNMSTLKTLIANTSNWTTGNTTTWPSFPSSPLPVELTSFNALIDGNRVTLNWVTATEVNNYGFNVEWRTLSTGSQTENENGEWRKIGFVQGHGNSNSPKNYSFVDQPLGGSKFKYRLKQIDFDGTFEYSNIVEVELKTPAISVLKQNHPNPFNPSTIISYRLSAGSYVTLKVYDVLGKEIATLVNEAQPPGNYEIRFNVETLHATSLPSGVYFYTIEAGNFLETKKMILMK